MCFWFIPKRLERPHPELVHWWQLFHSSPKHLNLGWSELAATNAPVEDEAVEAVLG
jgi:hypothetical protein